MVLGKIVQTNVTNKMIAISTDFDSIELNIYLLTTSYK